MTGAFRVLIVDDSTVFRSQLRAALEGIPGVEVASFATNGRMAIDLLKVQQVDLVILDLEMPEMNGLETLAEMKRLGLKTRVIVFSAHTKKAADTAITALTLGASDLVTKPVGVAGSGSPAELIRSQLRPKIEQFLSHSSAGTPVGARGADSHGPSAGIPVVRVDAPHSSSEQTPFPKNANLTQGLWKPKVVVVAASTGGPAALEKFFQQLTPTLRCPILIVQHMPPVFTAVLAERLARVSKIQVTEAKHGEALEDGHVYVAPGDYHMVVAQGSNGKACILLNQEPQRNSVRPAADFLFESAARQFGSQTLGIVFTGMGADGCDGAVAIKKASGSVLIQDRESCVVFGMPGSVAAVGAYDKMAPIDEIAQTLANLLVFRPNLKREAKVS